MSYIHPQFDKTACHLDDEGFEFVFNNQIGRTAQHTRWQHTYWEDLFVDVWLSKKKGITLMSNYDGVVYRALQPIQVWEICKESIRKREVLTMK